MAALDRDRKLLRYVFCTSTHNDNNIIILAPGIISIGTVHHIAREYSNFPDHI